LAMMLILIILWVEVEYFLYLWLLLPGLVSRGRTV